LVASSRHKEQVVDQTERFLKNITEVGGIPGYEHEVRAVNWWWHWSKLLDAATVAGLTA